MANGLQYERVLHYLETVFTDVTPQMTVVREERFG